MERELTMEHRGFDAALGRMPRYPLAAVPTPLEEAPHLSEELGVRVFVKRDDLTGLAFGGNKVRQMEFVVGEAMKAGADTLLAGGSIAQSNHARIAAAAARVAGLYPVIVVRPGARYEHNGNELITRFLAGEVVLAESLRHAPQDRLGEIRARKAVFDNIAQRLEAEGRRPYVMLGTSTGLGALGYAAASLELQAQFADMGIRPSHIVVTSAGATQAGLVLGALATDADYKVVGVPYAPTHGRAPDWIAEIASAAARLLGLDLRVEPDAVMSHDSEDAGPYGVQSRASRHAIQLAAQSEGLVLDPVYTAKGMAGLFEMIDSRRIPSGSTVVFIHTGGQPALFAYESEFQRLPGSAAALP